MIRIRPIIGAIGLLIVIGAAGTNYANPTASFSRIFIPAVIGMAIAYWGFKPYLGNR